MSPALKLTVITLWALSGAAHAAAADGQRVDDVTSYAFEEENVLGDQVRPNGDLVHVRKRQARESLIRVRMHFVNELCKSVEQL